MIGAKSGRARHLHDDHLYECFVAEQTGDVIDPRAAEHLADCSECSARYRELAEVMSGLRADADAEIDALYSADALHAQQSQIARRLEQLGHVARVISFPHHAAQGSVGAHAGRFTPRWLAAAAAAGLFIGVGVGSLMQMPLSHAARAGAAVVSPVAASPASVSPQAAAPEPAVATPASAPAVGTQDVSDPNDKFLDDLEFALARPRTDELRAFDDLTPHVRAISLTSRVQ